MNAILREAEIAGAREADLLAQSPDWRSYVAGTTPAIGEPGCLPGRMFAHGLDVALLKADALRPILGRARNMEHRAETKASIREALIAIRFIRDLARIADEIEEAVGKMEEGEAS